MHTEDTLSQVFHGLDINEIQLNSSYRYSVIENRVNDMMNRCQNMSQIRRRMFIWRERPPSPPVYEINVSDEDEEDLQEYAPPSTFRRGRNPFMSTPITDDEGYRSRLPTTASLNSSFSLQSESPILFFRMDSDSFSDIDDVMM